MSLMNNRLFCGGYVALCVGLSYLTLDNARSALIDNQKGTAIANLLASGGALAMAASCAQIGFGY